MRDIHTFVILAYHESDDLEDCIKSVLNQSVKSNVIIATSTKNDYIIELASQYALGVMVNDQKSNKGSDYNYAINTFDTKLVTIAHQDDLYDRNYVKEILKCYSQNKDASIIITDYYEIDNDRKIKRSHELFKKKILISPLKYKWCQDKKYFKMRSLKYGQSFCTSSVTFIKDNINKEPFPTNLTYNNDWQGFINLANEDSKFVYINKKLVGYRIYKKGELKEKEQEKLNIYKAMWPDKLIDYLYQKKEKSKQKKQIRRVEKNKNKYKKV